MNTTSAPDETTKVFGLLGFLEHPSDDQNIHHLLHSYDAAVFGLSLDMLPVGSLADQGYCEVQIDFESPVSRKVAMKIIPNLLVA